MISHATLKIRIGICEEVDIWLKKFLAQGFLFKALVAHAHLADCSSFVVECGVQHRSRRMCPDHPWTSELFAMGEERGDRRD